jgi:hypothetical protein
LRAGIPAPGFIAFKFLKFVGLRPMARTMQMCPQ